MSPLAALARILRRRTVAAPASPEELRRRQWDADARRKDLLARAMRNARYGPELTRDERSRALREEAIRISARRAEQRGRRP